MADWSIWSHKRCPGCDEMKHIDEYNKAISGKPNPRKYCRVCEPIKTREERQLKASLKPPVLYYTVEPPPGGKVCVACVTWKPYDEFHKHPSNEDGYRTKCKICRAPAVETIKCYTKRKGRAVVQNYRTRKLNVPGTFSDVHIQAMMIEQQGRCAYCAEPLPNEYDIDHIVPLARGGTNYPNNPVLTGVTCNRDKRDQLLYSEWEPLAVLETIAYKVWQTLPDEYRA